MERHKEYNGTLLFIGTVVLFLGTGIYLVSRPGDSAYFLRYNPFDMPSPPVISGTLGDIVRALPSFTHVFSFILLTAGLVRTGNRGHIVICAGWCIVDCLFETGQRYGTVIAAIIPDWFQGIPFLENTANFFRLGTFDPIDLAATIIGTAAAYVVIRMLTNKKDKELS